MPPKPQTKKVTSKESEYLSKLEDESESESESSTVSEEDNSISEEEISEEELSEEDSIELDDLDEDISDDASDEEKPEHDAPLEWIDNSVLESTDKIILTGDKRVMSDRINMNEFALLTSIRIAQIEAGSPIFLDKNPYRSTRDIAMEEIRQNANCKNGNYPLKIIRHSHDNIYEEWKVSEMSIPHIMSSGSIIETGN